MPYKPKLLTTNRKVGETLRSEGMSLKQVAEQAMMHGIVPACCKHHCNVEPDGICPHGNKSVLLEAGLI